jgi:ElaB/YqjD/DUF883 family membrane-anchored ribosome-binding protein
MTDRLTEEKDSELTRGRARTASAGGDLSQENEQEQLQHEIEETRAELGDTVDALAQKADVKARVSEKVEERKAEAKRAASRVARTAEERPFPAIAVALGLGLLIGRAIGLRERWPRCSTPRCRF